jgi:hypothetical protein
MEKYPIRSGRSGVLYVLRRAWGAHNKRRLNQQIFFEECQKIERERYGNLTEFVYRGSEDRKGTSKYEQQPLSKLSLRSLEIFAVALGLPPNFLVENNSLKDTETLDLAKRYWKGEFSAPAQPRPEAADRPGGRSERFEGFRRIGKDEIFPLSRSAVSDELSSAALAATWGNRSLTVIEGRTGVGKSFLVSHWFWGRGRNSFEHAFLMNCADMSIDQIRPASTEFFSAAEASAPSRCPRLLVLDGWRIERSRDTTWVSTPRSERRVPLNELVALINELLGQFGNLCIVLSIENNGDALVDSAFELLDRRAQLRVAQVSPLTVQEGVEFLAQSGLQLNERDLLKLSAQSHGMPLALREAARELRRLSEEELEHYLADMAAPEREPGGEFVSFFKNWLIRQDTLDEKDRRLGKQQVHPHALLRLLSIMSGPATRAELDEIVQEASVVRLVGCDLSGLERDEYPFVVPVDNRFDVHARVRAHLRSELQDYIAQDHFDHYTSRVELERIHWRAGVIKLRAIRDEPQGDAEVMSSLEAFVYHVLQQVRLIPRSGGSRNRRPTKSVSGNPKLLDKNYREGPGRLSNAQLWELAHSQVRAILFDKHHVSTRVYGQFEAKARILTHLVKASAEEALLLPQAVAESLPKEVALSWLHAGRLRVAQRSLETNTALLSPRHGPKDTDSTWIRSCELLSVEVAIRLRNDEAIEPLTDRLYSLIRRARSIAEEACNLKTPDYTREMPMLQRGALRILSRAADVALHAGDLTESHKLFELAIGLHSAYRDYPIDGECARRYAIALVRLMPNDAKAVETAQAIIQANINRYASDQIDAVRRGSNDVIPFLTMGAVMARLRGDLDGARRSLDRVRNHGFVRRRECTFLSLIDIELENLRQALLSGERKEDCLEMGQALARQLKFAHHYALAHDAEIICAEAMPPDKADPFLRYKRHYLSELGRRLRITDINLILQGRSAVREIGI